ncbi:hypothetical protein PDESU_02029 [Pontiella desulfatans]|uniref:Uncharacterized protein n=1 Tax=Pontiella desulfatans TaxID=2750659 RepID=A0A6C2U0M2_PONDE|nr:hypothetical protein [Pontiella desulfatans]VGO13472.1 hypothetical protein PDESU_02029 [Pontiella desulfatans]
MKRNPPSVIGRAKTVLVFENGSAPKAVVTAVIAKAQECDKPDRLTIAGTLRFDLATLRHIEENVLPVVDSICAGLGIGPFGFELSGVNLSAASNADVGIDVSGFSADAPVFAAMLSAALNIPLVQDVVLTGHMASVSGDIRLVRHIPAKIQAAIDDADIEGFLYPDVDADSSNRFLPAEERKILVAAIQKARRHIRITAVRTIEGIISAVFLEEDIVRSALRTGFGLPDDIDSAGDDPVMRTIQKLGGQIPERFHVVLKNTVASGDSRELKPLLSEWSDSYLRRSLYPHGFGTRLRKLLSVIPLETQRGLEYPLVPVSTCIRLSQYATADDGDDVVALYDAATRRRSTHYAHLHPSADDGPVSSTLAIVTAELQPENLAERIGLPIDRARAGYALYSVTSESQAETLGVAAAFYLHMTQATGRTGEHVTAEEVMPEAHALMGEAFAREGGGVAAYAEARDATRGGLRHVLDRMADEYKKRRQEEYIQFILATAFDREDYRARVAFMEDFLKAHPEALPPHLASEPPERFADRYDVIIRSFVDSMEQVKRVIGTL